MTAFVFDIGPLLLAAVLAAILVLRMRWISLGFIAGFFVFWACCWLRVEFLYAIDPHRDGGVGDAATVFIVSPILALAWCLLCLFVRLIYRFVSLRRGWRA